MAAKSLPVKTVCVITFLYAFPSCLHAQWQKTGGPPGMDVNAFYQRGNMLFAGTSAHGIFKSSDNGITWSASNSGVADKSVFSLVANASFIFAGTDSGVFRSQNNGATWQAANQGIEQKFVYCFLFANGFLFAGTSGGLYKSADNGSSWSDANGNALTSSIIHDIIFTQHLVVIADNLVFYSDDNGDSWNYNQNSPFILGVNPSFFARRDSVLLASGTGVFRSFDGGINWSNFITVTPGSNIDGLVGSKNYIVAGTKKGMFVSPNFGQTWKSIKAKGIRDGNWFTHNFYTSGKNFLLAYDEIGVGYSADSGKNWNYTLQGFSPAASIDNAMIFSNNTLFSGTHGDGVYKSSNQGSTWKKTGTSNNADTLSNSNVYALLKMKKILLAGTCGNGLYRSADNGISWVHITNGLPKQESGFLCVQSLAKTNKAVLIATDLGLYYSLDSGLSWKASNLLNKDVVAVAANDSVACAAVENFTGPSSIFRSVNNPATWNSVFEAFDADWTSMASDGKSHFYAGTLATSNFVSNNNGSGWQTVGGIPANSGGYAIGVLNSNVFIGNSDGIYFSKNNGISFSLMNTGFDKNHAVQGFAFSSTDVYAGLFQNSIWKRPLSDFGITSLQQPQKNKLPVTFFPNPMINDSKLTYTITSMGRVIIVLYDEHGNLIRQIKNAVQDAGNYSIIINKENLHTGSYFLSVIAGNQHAVISMHVDGN